MSILVVKQYLLIDGLNGRTVPVDLAEVSNQLQRMGRDPSDARRFVTAIQTRGVPYWARYVDAAITPNPAWVEDESETTQIVAHQEQGVGWEQPALVTAGEGR